MQRKLNAYRFIDDLIDKFKGFILNDTFPSKKIKDKFDGFIVSNYNLVYQPTGQIVCPPDERENVTNKIYNEYGLGAGQNNFHEKVSRLT